MDAKDYEDFEVNYMNGAKNSIREETDMEKRNILYHASLRNLNLWMFKVNIPETKQFERYIEKGKKIVNEFVWMINTQDSMDGSDDEDDEESEEFPLIPQTSFEETMLSFLRLIYESFEDEELQNQGFFFDMYIGDMSRHIINKNTLSIIWEIIADENSREENDKDRLTMNSIINDAFGIAMYRFLCLKFFQSPMGEIITPNIINTQCVPDTPYDILFILIQFVQEIGQQLVYMYDSKTGLKQYMDIHEDLIEKEIQKRQEENQEKEEEIGKLKKEAESLKLELKQKEKPKVQVIDTAEDTKKENVELKRHRDKLLDELNKLREKYDRLKQETSAKTAEPEDLKEDLQVDYNKKYLFVTNLVSDLPKRIMERFPNSNVLEAKKVSREIVTNSDMVVLFTNYLSHKEYYEIKSMCKNGKKGDTPIKHTTSFNIDKIEEVLKD